MLKYDCCDRMTSVTEGESTLQSMTYAPDGKRLSLTDSTGTRKFLYDGEDVIREYDSDWSSVNKEYTHGPWVDEPLSMTEHTTGQPNSTYYLMKDRLGSIINILEENEALKTTYSYDAFGEPTATYHSGQVDCPYRFTGREYDAGMGNYFYRARYYNQSLGRFFSRDPIMSLGSLYAYCNNSPASFADPMGLRAWTIGGQPVAGTSLGPGALAGLVVNGMPYYDPITGQIGGGGWWPGMPCASADPTADDDGDGIANGEDEDWLNADEDGDGYSNGDEMKAGSGIGDANSTPDNMNAGASKGARILDAVLRYLAGKVPGSDEVMLVAEVSNILAEGTDVEGGVDGGIEGNPDPKASDHDVYSLRWP